MPLKRKKKTDKQKLNEELWVLCKRYIRLRDKHICQKCRNNLEFADPRGVHTSHVYCKNRFKSLKYDELNLKLLCYSCHQWWHNVPLESRDWFAEKFPERFEYLNEKKKQIRKIGILELNEYIEEYTDKLIGLEIQNGQT